MRNDYEPPTLVEVGAFDAQTMGGTGLLPEGGAFFGSWG
jgi:hypothetical protein